MNKNKDINDLTIEILEVTSKIQEKFPELYVLLSETPLFHDFTNKSMVLKDFEQYLTSLKMQLETFEKHD
ncbi:MAG: hypothetical protein WAT79_01720 [Saprospiraceae bacterium]